MAVAESSEDKVVDSLIDRMQSTLNQLKAAQQKDVAGEAEEQGEPDEPEPKNLKDAGNKAYGLMKAERLKKKDQQ
jgi:hypothetical protein